MKLSVRAVVQLSSAIAALDGSKRVVKDGERELIVNEPYRFKAGFRLAAAKNLARLRQSEMAYTQARDACIMELSNGKGRIEGEAVLEFGQRDKQLLDCEEEVDLILIRSEELNLDQNAIPPTVLAALGPLIEDFAPKVH